MKKFAVMTMKGGTGKTTTAVSLSHGLSLTGKRVLLIDCDPQRSVSLTLILISRGQSLLAFADSRHAVSGRHELTVNESQTNASTGRFANCGALRLPVPPCHVVTRIGSTSGFRVSLTWFR